MLNQTPVCRSKFLRRECSVTGLCTWVIAIRKRELKTSCFLSFLASDNILYSYFVTNANFRIQSSISICYKFCCDVWEGNLRNFIFVNRLVVHNIFIFSLSVCGTSCWNIQTLFNWLFLNKWIKEKRKRKLSELASCLLVHDF